MKVGIAQGQTVTIQITIVTVVRDLIVRIIKADSKEVIIVITMIVRAVHVSLPIMVIMKMTDSNVRIAG